MPNYQEGTEGTPQYPYWKNEFDKEFKGYELWYSENQPSIRRADTADSYRVFMIYCNQNSQKPRLECVEDLKKATFTEPIKLGNEYFWAEKIEQ